MSGPGMPKTQAPVLRHCSKVMANPVLLAETLKQSDSCSAERNATGQTIRRAHFATAALSTTSPVWGKRRGLRGGACGGL